MFFQEKFEAYTPILDNKKLLLAVSGGVDSMVMLELFKRKKQDTENFHFEVAHINYKLRGEDSELDQKQVQDYCQKHQIKFHLYEVSERDKKPDGSIQLWARNLRYQFFFSVLEERKLDFLVTAHHLNDQLETFFINLSRGSGIKGLCGIPNNENKIIRPLLGVTKQEIYDFAKEQKIPFREDISNKKNDYLRNKIRNEIVPKLMETNENFLQNFQKTLGILSQTEGFIAGQISEIRKKITLKETENEWILDKEQLDKESFFVKFEILKIFGFNNETGITKIFTAETGSLFYSDAFLLNINRNELIISKKQTEEQENNDEIFLEINDRNEIFLPEKIKENLEKPTDFHWTFDAEKLAFPLKLRHKKTGDFFYPKGLNGKKKVSKFFKEKKISILAKSKI
ncbi:MAG: tRNA lysidine(34) synthetase TilS, partial [Bergeyella zoohelcum]|nr:tRNA lysidine(34) synthetase TilS [Bergeyella zoohelcum]